MVSQAHLSSALANPWATTVLSGAVTPRELRSNVAALAAEGFRAPDLAEPPDAYWSARARRPWR